MPTENLKLLDRRAERVTIIYQNTKDEVVRIAGLLIAFAVNAFKETDRIVRGLIPADRKGRGKRDLSIDPLGKEYDKVISVIRMEVPQAELPETASTMRTPDDLINAAQKVQTFLCQLGGVDENHPLEGEGESAPTGEQWAIGLARQMASPISTAVTEYNEAVATGRALQKAIEARYQARTAILLSRFRLAEVIPMTSY